MLLENIHSPKSDFQLYFALVGADVAVPHCVMHQDPSVTYDLNSWAETSQSRAKVAKLPESQPLFEGYDTADTLPESYACVFYSRVDWCFVPDCCTIQTQFKK